MAGSVWGGWINNLNGPQDLSPKGASRQAGQERTPAFSSLPHCSGAPSPKAAIHQGSPSLFPRKLPIAKTRTQKIPFPVNEREDASWGRGESLPPQPLRTKGRLLSPQFFPPTHRAVSLGRPLTHLLNSKAGATGRVRHTSQALLAGTVLTFLTGTNGVCI